jgi:ribosomal protein S18 acetylase RimI-like enzyme
VGVSVEVRATRPGDGAALARIWLDNARYYVELFPDDFRMPDEAGLGEWFETHLRKPRVADELHLVAIGDGSVGAFLFARLSEPDENASRQMLADYPHRRVHVEALGTANAFRQRGLATALVETAESWARDQGARAISAETYLESPVSIPFWEERMGYRRRSVKLTKRLS